MKTMIAILFLALFGTNAIPVEAREFEEIPLPAYITIATAPAALPADEAVFLGSWEGKWDGVQPTILVVTDIDPKTHEVRGIYGQDNSNKKRKKAYSVPFTGKIGLDKKNRKVLQWTFRNGRNASFRMSRSHPTRLKGSIRQDGKVRTKGKFTRAETDTDPKFSSLPLDEVAEANSAFLGTWCGIWNNSKPTTLAVVGVNGEGGVSGYYTYKNRSGFMFNGTIRNGSLRFTTKNGVVQHYELKDDDTLAGTEVKPRRVSTTRSKRCEPPQRSSRRNWRLPQRSGT
jgi:hypothetical protein